jgi:hypothetical protein
VQAPGGRPARACRRGARARGRINRWTTRTADPDGIDFPHVTQIACIRCDVLALDGVPVSKEHALAATSGPADRIDPADLHTHAHGHWVMADESRYVRDMVWRGDASQSYVGNGQQAMATLRHLALGLCRLNGIHKIKEATEWICRDRTRALPLLAT